MNCTQGVPVHLFQCSHLLSNVCIARRSLAVSFPPSLPMRDTKSRKHFQREQLTSDPNHLHHQNTLSHTNCALPLSTLLLLFPLLLPPAFAGDSDGGPPKSSPKIERVAAEVSPPLRMLRCWRSKSSPPSPASRLASLASLASCMSILIHYSQSHVKNGYYHSTRNMRIRAIAWHRAAMEAIRRDVKLLASQIRRSRLRFSRVKGERVAGIGGSRVETDLEIGKVLLC